MFKYKNSVWVIGPANSGKSALIARFIDGKYEEDYISTFARMMYTKNTEQGISVQIYDTPGGEFFRRAIYQMVNFFFSGFKAPSAFIIACNLSRKESLEEVKKYWQEFKDNVSVPESCSVFLVGTKGDLEPLMITPEELQDLAKDIAEDSKINVSYQGITSAKTGGEVNELFTKITSITTEKKEFSQNSEQSFSAPTNFKKLPRKSFKVFDVLENVEDSFSALTISASENVGNSFSASTNFKRS